MHVAALSLAAILAIGVSACGGEASDGPLGAASQAEIDPGNLNYLIYGLYDVTGYRLGQVLATGATPGDGFAANTEYWYLNENLSNSSTLTWTGGISQPWSTPPTGLGTLSFTMAATPTWTSGAVRGTFPMFASSFSGEYDVMEWNMSDSGGTWTGSITWWHNTASELIGPGASMTLTPGRTGGTHYYFVNTPL
jgi:hypothetical protein